MTVKQYMQPLSFFYIIAGDVSASVGIRAYIEGEAGPSYTNIDLPNVNVFTEMKVDLTNVAGTGNYRVRLFCFVWKCVKLKVQTKINKQGDVYSGPNTVGDKFKKVSHHEIATSIKYLTSCRQMNLNSLFLFFHSLK